MSNQRTVRQVPSVLPLEEFGKKRCSTCLQMLPFDDFSPHPHGRFGYRSSCKPCQSKAATAWRHANNDRYLDYTLRRKFGITLADYNVMLAEQGGVCAICGEPPTFENSGRWAKRRKGAQAESRLVVDHCHTTGKVRGLLCGRCNTGIGFLKDSADLVRLALDYLEERSRCQT